MVQMCYMEQVKYIYTLTNSNHWKHARLMDMQWCLMFLSQYIHMKNYYVQANEISDMSYILYILVIHLLSSYSVLKIIKLYNFHTFILKTSFMKMRAFYKLLVIGVFCEF